MSNPFKVFIAWDNDSETCVYEREIQDHEILNCRDFAAHFASEHCESELDDSTGIIPRGCADFTVTLSEHGFNSAICWQSESFFLKREQWES